MSITTYSELRAAIENWLDHTLFTTRVPEFIELFESTLNRRLRVRQQEATISLAPSNGSATLPADFLSVRRLTWTGQSRVELEYVQPSWLQAAYPAAPAGVPRVYTIEGSTLRIRPVDATALELVYFQKVPPLSDAAPTNWLLTSHPDLYLFGSLTEAEMFRVNDESAGLLKDRREELYEEFDRRNLE